MNALSVGTALISPLFMGTMADNYNTCNNNYYYYYRSCGSLPLLLFHKIGILQPIYMDWEFIIELNHKAIQWKKTNGINLVLDVQLQHLQ